MNAAHHLSAAALFCAMGGCVLPVPTTRTEVPAVHGRVVHAQSGAPVDMAGVMIEGHKETAVLSARDGSFHTDVLTHSTPFLMWNPFQRQETKTVKLRVARPGFRKHTEKIEWRGASQSEVYLSSAIRLQPKGIAGVD